MTMVTTSELIYLAKGLPLFQELVRHGRATQGGRLTRGQYVVLEAAFLKAREPVSWPIFGWAWGSFAVLHHALREEGVSVSWDT